MTMTPQDYTELVELVKQEALELRKHASPAELSKLDFDTLNADITQRCIYGQITGSCYGTRAYELIKKCAIRVYKPSTIFGGLISGSVLNGEPHDLLQPYHRQRSYHSPIEKFIMYNEYDGELNNNKLLIDYLKGKTETLNFE